jgi:hypothetical protein
MHSMLRFWAWAWWRPRPRPSLQDDSDGIRWLEITYAKFGRRSEVCQINFIQPKHACWLLLEWSGAPERIRRRSGLFGLFLWGAYKIDLAFFQWSCNATVRHHKRQTEYK